MGVSLGQATLLFRYPSGKAIKVRLEDGERTIPNFAIHDDSEIWEKCEIDTVGDLIVKESWAKREGII